jgi:hypothetical protein
MRLERAEPAAAAMKGRDVQVRRAGAYLPAIVWLVLSAGGCSDPPDATVVAPGSVSLTLRGSRGIHIEAVDYTIDRGDYHSTGVLSVGASGTLSAIISPVPAGAGYQLSMAASNVAGETPRVHCAGSTTFDVSAGSTAAATVNLRCQEEKVIAAAPAAVPSSSSVRAVLAVALLAIGAAMSRRRRGEASSAAP